MNKKKTVNSKKVNEMVSDYTNKDSFKSDPNGSYTGKPEIKGEKPIQDADDL